MLVSYILQLRNGRQDVVVGMRVQTRSRLHHKVNRIEIIKILGKNTLLQHGLWGGGVVWKCGVGVWCGGVVWVCGVGVWCGGVVR